MVVWAELVCGVDAMSSRRKRQDEERVFSNSEAVEGEERRAVSGEVNSERAVWMLGGVVVRGVVKDIVFVFEYSMEDIVMIFLRKKRN